MNRDRPQGLLADLNQLGWRPLNPGVGAGEASAACRWRDLGDSVLLVVDDRAGRLEASAHGMDLIATAGLIGLARLAGLVPMAQPMLQR